MELHCIGIAEDVNMVLWSDLCAIGSSGLAPGAGRSRQHMLLAAVIWVAAEWILAQPSAAERYQGLVRPFQRRGKT
jgi:hypothetical protein